MLGSTLERVDWPRAAAEFDEAVRRAPDNDVLFYNLGLIYSGNGLFEEALAFFERSNAINPRHIASVSRVRPADKVHEMRLEVERLKAIEARLAEGIGASAGAGVPPRDGDPTGGDRRTAGRQRPSAARHCGP